MHINIKYIKFPLLLAILSFLTFNKALSAENESELKLYNIEVIVFKYDPPAYFKTEVWDENWTSPDIEQGLDVTHITQSKLRLLAPKLTAEQRQWLKYYRKLPSKEKTLPGIATNLEKSKSHTLLSYTAWQQPGLPEAEAAHIRIKGGQILNLPFLKTDSIITNEDITQATTTSYYELDGLIKVTLGRFLHIDTNLLLKQPVQLVRSPSVNNIVKTPINEHVELAGNMHAEEPATYQLELTKADNPQARLFGFNLIQHRRMRSNEIHHIDHPMYGIIIKASPSNN